MKYLLTAYLLSFNCLALTINVGESKIYKLNELQKSGSDYNLVIDKLVLNDNSILAIPEELAPNAVVNLTIKELTINGNAAIVQTYNEDYDFINNPGLSYFLFPRGRNGGDGASASPNKNNGDLSRPDGQRGSDGFSGADGRNSLRALNLDVGAKKIDNLLIAIVAENGGNGGKGGNGQPGNDGVCEIGIGGWDAGRGGDGGHGGRGGKPGKAGSISFRWKNSGNILGVNSLPVGVDFLIHPGLSGEAGLPGLGGLGGNGVEWGFCKHDIGANGKNGDYPYEALTLGQAGSVYVEEIL